MKKMMKWAGDYRWDTATDENGKVKNVYVYTGPLFKADETGEEHAVRRIRLLLAFVIALVLFVPQMILSSNLARNIFVILPFSINLFTLLFFGEGLVTYWKYKEELTRPQKEKTVDRFKAASFAGSFLFLVSTVAAYVVIAVFLVKISVFDVIFAVCDTLLTVIFVLTFMYTRKFTTKECENPIASEWEKL